MKKEEILKLAEKEADTYENGLLALKGMGGARKVFIDSFIMAYEKANGVDTSSDKCHIQNISNNEVVVCKSTSATWNNDIGKTICDECGNSHPLQTDC